MADQALPRWKLSWRIIVASEGLPSWIGEPKFIATVKIISFCFDSDNFPVAIQLPPFKLEMSKILPCRVSAIKVVFPQ